MRKTFVLEIMFDKLGAGFILAILDKQRRQQSDRNLYLALIDCHFHN